VTDEALRRAILEDPLFNAVAEEIDSHDRFWPVDGSTNTMPR
jgi:hypothetical protein